MSNQPITDWKVYNLPKDLTEVLEQAPSVKVANTVDDLINLAVGGADQDHLDVKYALPDGKEFHEVVVNRVRNGIAANYTEAYMRRRDPDCMLIGDSKKSDKQYFKDRFGYDFDVLRKETFEWLKGQPLAIFAFRAGRGYGYDSIAVVPDNAGFFAFGLSLLQGIVPFEEVKKDFNAKGIIYTAPPFRHTHFEGKQVVVHVRGDECHELFSYNLYPGPSAKKGVYGMLLTQGESESWVTAHCSTVKVVTPYDYEVVLMHEGASGGGKSEMLQHPHRLSDGRLLLGKNIVTGEIRHVELPRTCDLFPVTDDMALCHPSLGTDSGRLTLTDAEEGWFVRVDHITEYGTDPDLEGICAKPPRDILFLNIDAVANSRAMIWEHIEDEPGKPCPNPRVILPRDIVPNVVNDAIEVQVRSIGVRTPPCTKENPSYGIMGIMHLLPPSLAWLWRLVAPRGHANPSIVSTKGMSSEGVGSYWPFATGRRVDQANLLLEQFVATPKVRYILTPNQHIGAWETSFMPQWLAREYIARRGGANFKDEHLRHARCPLLGKALHTMTIEGRPVPRWFLQVDTQPEVGEEAYDIGAEQLYEFFRICLKKFDHPDLAPLGRDIIQCCLDKGTFEDYAEFIKQK
ncbi:MAG: DUF4914 family protein [Sumerlaeia bacterium]